MQNWENFFDHFLTLRRHDHVITIPPISQAGVGNSEIATVILKRIPLGSLSQKMSEIGLVVWAVGGGAIRFGPCASSISV